MKHIISLTTIFLTTIFVACNNSNKPTENFPIQTNTSINSESSSIVPDTVKPIITTSFSQKTFPQIFEAAYFKDTKAQQNKMDYAFYVYDIGKINCESGELIACDPITMSDGIPFTQTFPKGQFSVQLAMATTSNDERVAFARIVFSKENVDKWEFALLPGQKQLSLKDTDTYCYGVDAGTGLFIDKDANAKFNSADYSKVFVGKIIASKYKGLIHDFDGHNLATFSTGYGDGCYSTYIGFDKQGKVCRLITDFGLVEWWKLEAN